jgi:hypothetical protein
VKFRANQSLHTIMKLYQFTEDLVNKILLQRNGMFHILYDIVVSTVQVSCLETPGEKKRDKERKKD